MQAIEKSPQKNEISRAEQPTIIQLIAEMSRREITSEGVAAMAELVKLKKTIDADEAEKEFARAMSDLQSKMPKVTAKNEVRNSREKGGGVRYTFASFEDIMDRIGPYATAIGFSISFRQDYAKEPPHRVIVTCIVTHHGGHSKEYPFAVRVGAGPQGCSEAQCDAAAATLAKRYALCAAFNITTTDDSESDARFEGAPITPIQAQSLRDRVSALYKNADTRARFEAAFLKLGKATEGTYETVSASMLDTLEATLREKENPK